MKLHVIIKQKFFVVFFYRLICSDDFIQNRCSGCNLERNRYDGRQSEKLQKLFPSQNVYLTIHFEQTIYNMGSEIKIIAIAQIEQ